MRQRFAPRIAPAVVAVLALAACGGDDDSSATPIDPPSSVVDTTDDGSSSQLRTPRPIEVVSGRSAGSSSASGQAEPALAEDAATGELAIAPWVAEYEVGEGLPPLPTNDVGYVFDASGEASAEQVAQIAAAFGIGAEPVRIDEGFGASWRVGPDDGSAPSVWVYDDGMLSWNFNASWSEGVTDVACAVTIDSEGNESSDCPEPEPPTGVPSADEAQQRAIDLLAALGVDASELTFDTFANEWFASVEASDRTDERAAVRSWSFGFGAEGLLQFAGGSLASPEQVGPYPLVDLETAVARLSDGFYGGSGGIGIAEGEIAVSSGVTGAPAEGDEVAPSEPAEPTEPVEPPDDPMPVEPVPDPEPVVVTLVDVEPDLWWAWDTDGSVWLLPAYRFIDADGGWHVAPAVTDEFLVQAAPGDGEPIPVEPDGGIGDGAEPLPAPEPDVPEPDVEAPDVPDADVPDAVDVKPITDPEVARSVLDEFVGLSIEEFTAEAGALGFDTRIVQEDGEPLAVTDDYSPARVNVVVEGPRVTSIESVG